MQFLLLFFCLCNFLISPIEALTKEQIPIVTCPLNKPKNRKAPMAICAIFQDEGEFIKEWIEYHRLVGVSHFYLYNNLSVDQYWAVLKPYVDKGIVEIFDVPFDSRVFNDGANTHNFVQNCCYNHALSLSRGYNEWLGIIDMDEFICPVIDSTIPQALARYGKKIGGIAVYWQIYGTSNIWDLNKGECLVEKMLLKEPNVGGNGMFKSIVRPKYANKCIDPHWTTCQVLPMILPNGQAFSHTPNFASLPVDVIRINHYTFRTGKFYEAVKKPRKERWGFRLSPEQEQAYLDSFNTVYDPVMLRFVPALKQRMLAN